MMRDHRVFAVALCLWGILSLLLVCWRYVGGGSSFFVATSSARGRLVNRDASKDTFLFGFFLQAHKQPKATLEVVRSVKAHMPEAPLYLVSSAGYHYGPLASRFPNIHYTYDPRNVNLPQGNAKELPAWFERIQAAAMWCNCTYLVLLEDDVLMRKALDAAPDHDLGGVTAHLWTRHWPGSLLEEFNGTNWSYESHGMCGGSYVRTSAFLDAYRNVDWERIGEMGKHWNAIGRFNDVTMAVVMMDRGYALRPWKDLTERGKPSYDENASLVHQMKQYYDIPLTEADGPVIDDDLNGTNSW
jgi:hypothetical protein